jgi:hypothetical protein
MPSPGAPDAAACECATPWGASTEALTLTPEQTARLDRLLYPGAASRDTFQAVTVSNQAGPGRPKFVRGPSRDKPSEAGADGQAELEAGRAVLAFVVRRAADGREEVMTTFIWPKRDRAAILHYLELVESLGR